MRPKNYCSKECHDLAQFKGEIKECASCGKKIRVSPCNIRENNFCSKECRLEWLSGHVKQTINIPGRSIKRVSQKEKRKIIYETALGKRDEPKRIKNGYIQIFGMYVHRVVAEEKLGRKLLRTEIVHHIDGNKQNNHPDNLMIFTSHSEHKKWHWEHDSEINKKGDDANVNLE